MLAHHWLAAHNLPRALPASVRAGKAAAAAGVPSAAQRHFERALELWPQVPDAEQRAGIDHSHLLEAAALAAAGAGAVERGLALVDQALGEVGYGGTLERRATLLVRRATLLGDLARDSEALAVFEQAEGLLPRDLPSKVSAQVLGSFARALYRVDQFSRAGELAQRALEAAQAVDATEERLEAQYQLSFAMAYGGDVEGGIALVEQVAGEATQAGLPGLAARSFIVVSDFQLMVGRYDEAEGDLREARRHLRNSMAAQFTLPLVFIEAELARAGGDLTAARQIISDALRRDDLGDDPRYKWPLMSLGGRVEAELNLAARDAGDAGDDAERRIAELHEDAERTAATTPAAFGHLALVRAEHARVRREDEVDAWTQAVTACRAMNESLPLAYALLRRAETLIEHGQTEEATTSAREALELAQMMGAAPILEDVQALIRRARLSVNGRDETEAAAGHVPDELERLGLTAREAEVLRMVAEGLPNTQIADELVISRKTASVHVSNILAKLGVSTRVEAAAMAHRRGLIRISAES